MTSATIPTASLRPVAARAPRPVAGTRPSAAAPSRGLSLRRMATFLLVPGEARAVVPAAPARVVQERLVHRGFLGSDAVTGRWDRVTVGAVEAFQSSAGLAVDGLAARHTVDALLVDRV